jgi:hypothetical protein
MTNFMELTLLQKLPVAQIHKNFPKIIEPEVSVFCSQEPSIWSQINAVHTTSCYLSKIHLNIILPPMSRFSPQNSIYIFLTFISYILLCYYIQFFIRVCHNTTIQLSRLKFLFSLISTRCPVHLILLDLIILIIFEEEYR